MFGLQSDDPKRFQEVSVERDNVPLLRVCNLTDFTIRNFSEVHLQKLNGVHAKLDSQSPGSLFESNGHPPNCRGIGTTDRSYGTGGSHSIQGRYSP